MFAKCIIVVHVHQIIISLSPKLSRNQMSFPFASSSLVSSNFRKTEARP